MWTVLGHKELSDSEVTGSFSQDLANILEKITGISVEHKQLDKDSPNVIQSE